MVILLLILTSSTFAQSFKETYSFGNSLLGIERITTKGYGQSFARLTFNRANNEQDNYSNLAIPGATSDIVLIQLRKEIKHNTTFIFIEGGINDIVLHKLLTKYPRGFNKQADTVSDKIFNNLKRSVENCPPKCHIVLFTMPSFNVLQSKVHPLNNLQKTNADTHLEYINNKLRALENPRICVVEFGPFYEQILLNPPVVDNIQMQGFPHYGKYDYITIDGTHPGAITNGLVANLVIETINNKWNLNIKKYSDKELLKLYY